MKQLGKMIYTLNHPSRKHMQFMKVRKLVRCDSDYLMPHGHVKIFTDEKMFYSEHSFEMLKWPVSVRIDVKGTLRTEHPAKVIVLSIMTSDRKKRCFLSSTSLEKRWRILILTISWDIMAQGQLPRGQIYVDSRQCPQSHS